ncbi:hypothetical protein [Kribbella antiqua]|uniref:hypothetical protein n=1 Tax=Kribbella antiqua TaxID=2512217 RepID=UPI001050D3EE|nr:hypothetical protein [Kribbella antiqua]
MSRDPLVGQALERLEVGVGCHLLGGGGGVGDGGEAGLGEDVEARLALIETTQETTTDTDIPALSA